MAAVGLLGCTVHWPLSSWLSAALPWVAGQQQLTHVFNNIYFRTKLIQWFKTPGDVSFECLRRAFITESA